MGIFTMNWKFLPPKLHYGLFYAGTGTVFPFMSVFAKTLGLSSRTVGTVYTILPLLALVFKPIFGAIADKYKWHRNVMIAWDFLVMAAYFAIYFIPAPATVATDDNPDASFGQWQFWVFLVLLSLTWVGTAVVTTISDTMTIEICGTIEYGRQRFWGSVSWGITALITGVIIDAVSTEEETNYAPAFYFMLPFMIADLIISYWKFDVDMPILSESISKDVWKVMRTPRNLIFSLWCAAQGVNLGLVWNFVYWHLEDLAAVGGYNSQIKTIEGMNQAMTCFIGEGPAFFMSGWIVMKIGHGHAISLVFLLIGLRFIFYSILVNPWWSLPVEFFQGHYGIFYAAMTSYAKKVGPPGTEATIQSVLCAICEGVGVALGSFIAGYVYEANGGAFTFRYFGVAFFVLAVLSECNEMFWRLYERKHPSAVGPSPE